ncbi:hypothetical protein [Mycobacterium sp. TY815]|uniref:hypothetical protein n=1 Tax=unclassified Mycobacterium TaxID=2642494 RepID=UPI0027426F02|nr:hypothetical protein [Mycobacterium sp. TY815]MDP7707113.1 hypothetical protein [Mycobacterium sp. TY815]
MSRISTIHITGPPTAFGAYSRAWVEQRPISGSTRAPYRRLLTEHILPTFAALSVSDISAEAVAIWHADTAPSTPVTRIHAYALLRSIMQDALDRNLIEFNPCARLRM